jgi:branched-subunit amino acid transport protein
VSVLGIIAGMALATYLTRVTGLWLAASVPEGLARSLRLVPIAVFAALAVPALPGVAAAETAVRVAVAGLAAVATRVTRRLWIGIAVGMLALWALQ